MLRVNSSLKVMLLTSSWWLYTVLNPNPGVKGQSMLATPKNRSRQCLVFDPPLVNIQRMPYPATPAAPGQEQIDTLCEFQGVSFLKLLIYDRLHGRCHISKCLPLSLPCLFYAEFKRQLQHTSPFPEPTHLESS